MFLKVETAEGNGDEVLRECVIEKALVKEAKSRGGMAVKFVSPGFDGVPDRLVLLPGGKCAFVELKAPGKKLRPLQAKRKHQLEALGFSVYDRWIGTDRRCAAWNSDHINIRNMPGSLLSGIRYVL